MPDGNIEILEDWEIFGAGTGNAGLFTEGAGGGDIRSSTGNAGNQAIFVVGGTDSTGQEESQREIEAVDYTELLQSLKSELETTNQRIVTLNNNNLIYYKASVYMSGLIVGMFVAFLFIGRMR